MMESIVTCSTVAEQIHPYLDGELADPTRAEVERHLDGCATCRESLAAFQGLGRLLRRELTDAAGPSPSLWPVIEGRLGANTAGAPSRGRMPGRPDRAARPRARWSWRTVVPAAAAAAVVVAVSLQWEPKPDIPPEAPAQVASVEGGEGSSVVLLAGTPSDPPVILVTETPAMPRLLEGGSSL